MSAGTAALDDLSVRRVLALHPARRLSPFSFSLSAVGHLAVLGLLAVLPTFGTRQLDQTKVYMVNLTPGLGVEAPAPPEAGSMTVEMVELSPPTAKTPPDAPPPQAPARKPEAVELKVPSPQQADKPAPLVSALPDPVLPPRPAPKSEAAESSIPLPPFKAKPVLPDRVLPAPLTWSALSLPDTGLKEHKEIPSLPPPPRPFSSPLPPATALPPRLPRIDDDEPRTVALSRVKRRPAGPEPPPPEPPRQAAPSVSADSRAPKRPVEGPSGPAPAGKRSSLTLETTDFPFTYYLQQLQRKVSERWVPPASTPGGLQVVVFFEIGRDGRIGAPSVEKSSGNAFYDLSALRAVTEASPFPPLPQEFSAASLRVHFGFEVSAPLAQAPGRP